MNAQAAATALGAVRSWGNVSIPHQADTAEEVFGVLGRTVGGREILRRWAMDTRTAPRLAAEVLDALTWAVPGAEFN